MGAVVARFRKKQTTVEVLEGLDKEIQSLEQFKRHNEELQRRYVGGLLIYSIVLYIAAAVMFYFLFFPEGWEERVVRSLPLLMFPLLIWAVKKLLHWYFVRRITKKESQLEDLREKKKNILEDVMEHETYKAAKEILERFGPSKEEPAPEQTPPGSPRRQPGPTVPTPAPPGQAHRRKKAVMRLSHPRHHHHHHHHGTTRTTGHQELRQRRTPGPNVQPNIPRMAVAPTRVETPPQGTPAPLRPPGHPPAATPSMGRPPGPPLARPILPRERTVFDRVVDYLVGEGPSSRFALICQQCHSHNGMALQEEFEFITFRCAYCYTLNPARKVRPTAPKLLPDKPPPQRLASTDEACSEEEQRFILNDKDSDSEAKFPEGKDDEKDCGREEMVREEEKEMTDTVAIGNRDLIPEEVKAGGDGNAGKAVEDVTSEMQDIGQEHMKED